MEAKKVEFNKDITKIGNSDGIIVPAWVRQAFGITKGDKVKVVIEKIDQKSFQ